MSTPGTDLAGIPDVAAESAPARSLRSRASLTLAGVVLVLGVLMAALPALYALGLYAVVLTPLLVAAAVMRGWRGLRSGAVVPREIWTMFITAMIGWVPPLIAVMVLLPVGRFNFGYFPPIVLLLALPFAATAPRTYSASRRWVTLHTNPQQLQIEAANEAVGRGRDGEH